MKNIGVINMRERTLKIIRNIAFVILIMGFMSGNGGELENRIIHAIAGICGLIGMAINIYLYKTGKNKKYINK